MKTLKTTFFIALFIGVFACQHKAKLVAEETISAEGKNRIEIFDFHNEHRCVSCLAIESHAKETLRTFFSKEMASGLIQFHLINADLPENEALVVKHNAYGSTLVIKVVKEGKEVAYDITDFAFLNSENKEKFMEEFRQKVEEQLANL